jgi:hypothetical protein
MPESMLDLGDRLAGDRSVLDRLSEPPWTLVHGDARVNNIIFGSETTAGRPLFLDWQTAIKGRGPMDVAFLFVSSLAADDRRSAEASLLPLYHSLLIERGVSGYTYPDCWRDYRLAIVNQMSQIVALSYLLRENESRPDDSVGAITGARLVSAVAELPLAELLPAARLSRSLRFLRRISRRLRR